MENQDILKFLETRGLVSQVTFRDQLATILKNEKINFYIGFDPTADSLHVGHLLMLRVAKLLQKNGHKPFLILGGGTGHVGDPSGRTDMRKLLTTKNINENVAKFKKQMQYFLSFTGKNKAEFINNADWLLKLKWVDVLREVGTHISVNKMLATDAYKSRWENGLSFLELNYMVMQSYDFLHLNRSHNVILQLGGNDQWANILSGVDLIRRLEHKTAFALTLTLLTNSSGQKMGKTVSGALWLNAEKMSVYDFYQYWINVADKDLEKLFLMLTDLDQKEIKLLVNKKGKAILETKQLLAFLLTEMVHGTKAAKKAQEQTIAGFVVNDVANMVETTISLTDKSVVSLLVTIGFCKSKSEARRLISENAIMINDKKITDSKANIPTSLLLEKTFVVYKGKKQRIKVKIKEKTNEKK